LSSIARETERWIRKIVGFLLAVALVALVGAGLYYVVVVA
jgi:hypothetical protein